MTKSKTPFEKLKEKVPVYTYTEDLNNPKPFNLKKALNAARKLKDSTFYDDEDSLRAKPTLRS